MQYIAAMVRCYSWPLWGSFGRGHMAPTSAGMLQRCLHSPVPHIASPSMLGHQAGLRMTYLWLTGCQHRPHGGSRHQCNFRIALTKIFFSTSMDDLQDLSCSCCMQDVVTRGGKFLFLYKRPGKRVIVNDFGHFIVSPNSIEASIQQNTVGTYTMLLPSIVGIWGNCMLPGLVLHFKLSLPSQPGQCFCLSQ